jgi:hypothetical protein
MNRGNSVQPVGPLLAVLCVATAVDIGAGWLLGQRGFGSHARIIFALLPIPANLVLVAVIVLRIRQLDEFLRHTHLEAVAIAFLLTGLAVFVYGYLQKGRTSAEWGFQKKSVASSFSYCSIYGRRRAWITPPL